MTQIIQTPEQQFYLAKLLGYTYEIVYRPGAQNRVADALSRAYCFMITIPQLDFMARLKEQLQNDTQFQELVQKIQQDPLTYPDYKLLDGLIYFKGKLFLTTNSPMKQLLLEEFHATPIGGHSGIHRTYGRIKENVY
jgi:hypothetical protein